MDIEALNLSQYEAKDFVETPSKGGYISYGADNLYPQYLVDLFKSSATHNALCTSIAYMIYGEGLQTLDVDAKIKIAEWSLDDEIRKSCLDLKVQGGFALEIIYSLDRTSISKVRHLPFENVRSGEVNEREHVDFYYYSRDWGDRREEPQTFHAFDPKEAVEFPVQILYVKPFTLGSFYYPKPDYIGSVNYIELDKEISIFHINNIKNGLAPSFMINFKNGTPPIEERRRIRTDLENQLAGAGNTGKFFITFSDQPDRAPDFEPFPISDLDKQYQFLSGETTDKIMVGHRVVSSAMFGVASAGKLGSTQELEIASDLFTEQVIDPFRRVVNNALQSLFNAAGISDAPRLEALAGAEEASVEQSFTGVQIGSAVDIIAKVGLGELTSAQAIQLLVSMLGFTKEIAEEMFNNISEPTQEALMCSDGHSEFQELASDFLLEAGEEVDESEWELIDEREVDYDLEEAHDEVWNFTREEPTRLERAVDSLRDFARAPKATPKKTSTQDTTILKVRYVYAPDRIDTETYKSREFCRKMVSSKRVYRREDIIAAGKQRVNKGWGANGADTYDIWRYKGGGSCAHFWARQTFLKRGNKKLTAKQARAEINKVEPSKRKAATPKKNPKIVAQRPRDMGGKKRGFLKPKNWTTPR